MELLVVMVVISILLTITVPAISKARSKAHTYSCIVNLRSIGQSITTYSIDFNDSMIPANFGDTSDGGYGHFINYMISVLDVPESIFRCQGMSQDSMFDPAGHDPLTGNIHKKASYIMNIVKEGAWGGAPVPGGAHGWGYDSKTPIQLGIVSNPAEKIQILDAMAGISNSHSGVNNFQRSDHGLVNDPPTGMVRWVGNHHLFRFNAVFGDGHAETLSRSSCFDWAVNR